MATLRPRHPWRWLGVAAAVVGLVGGYVLLHRPPPRWASARTRSGQERLVREVTTVVPGVWKGPKVTYWSCTETDIVEDPGFTGWRRHLVIDSRRASGVTAGQVSQIQQFLSTPRYEVSALSPSVEKGTTVFDFNTYDVDDLMEIRLGPITSLEATGPCERRGH